MSILNFLSDEPVIGQDKQESRFRWATVETTSPLSIRFDTTTEPIDATPITLIAGLNVSDRVWCQLINRQVIIVGKAQA